MDTARTHRKVTPIVASALLALVIAGCSATPSASEQTPSEPAQSAPSPSASAGEGSVPSSTPTPLATPAPVEGEIARATYENDGPDGVPSGASITSGVLDGTPLRFASACVGSQAKFKLTTAAVGEKQRILIEDTVVCDDPSDITMNGVAYTGPVQLSFVDTNDIDQGWVLLVPQKAVVG